MTEQMKEHLLRVGKICDSYEALPKPSEMLMMGVEHFISNLWHDASELPDNPDTVVIEHSEYGTSVCLACTMRRVKGAVWCYLDDILPDNK